MVACAAQDDHCCYLRGSVCHYLRDDGPAPGRRWVCTLRETLGSWDAVHDDPRYRRDVAPVVRALVGVDCGDWPRRHETCATCGVTG